MKLGIALAVVALCGLLSLAACAPAAQAPASNDAKDGTPATEQGADSADTTTASMTGTGTVMKDFLDRSSGQFPDTFTNTDMLNAGNRGCNACHEDLFEMIKILEPQHIIVSTGYGKSGTIFDCFGCHTRHVAETGPYLGDLLHGYHYSSPTFVENNGNCWSCHAVKTEQTYSRDGDYDFLLWEDIKYSPQMGGYVDGGDDYNEWWNKARDDQAWTTGFFNGVTVDTEPKITMEYDQRITPVEDAFVCDNFVRDLASMNTTDHGIEVFGGVKNPRSFTYEELAAMPQETWTATQTCSTNGLGGSLISNIEWTGVPISYLVEQCGGLEDGVNQIYYTTDEAERGFPTGSDDGRGNAATVAEMGNHLLALQMNGEAMGDSWGPYVIVQRGMPAGAWVKHMSTIEFAKEDEPHFLYDPSWCVDNPKDTSTHFWLNAGWLNNDGVTFSMADGVDLSGWGFGWSSVKDGLTVKQFKVSMDYGQNWETFDIPAGMDPYQWVTFNMHWDPPAPGTYVLKLDAVNENGDTVKGEPGCANLLINVTE